MEAVRAAVRAVPAGETSTYGEIAATAGIPGRARLRIPSASSTVAARPEDSSQAPTTAALRE